MGRIRKVDPESSKDLEQFCELMEDLSSGAENRELLQQKIRDFNAREDCCLLVMEQDGKLVGSVCGILFGDFCGDCAPLCAVENVLTHHDYRHQGVMKELFTELETWMKEKGAKYAFLCSGNSRSGAHRFYQEMGYEEVKGFKKRFL